MELDKVLIDLGFKYIEHRGSIDRFVKDNTVVELPRCVIIRDGNITHMIPPYKMNRILEVIKE